VDKSQNISCTGEAKSLLRFTYDKCCGIWDISHSSWLFLTMELSASYSSLRTIS